VNRDIDWWNNATTLLRRDEVKPGMVIHSSHGYRLLIEKVEDTAKTRTDERIVGFVGRLHGDPEGLYRCERYSAGSRVPVEVER
jgi:hypothetical protein